MKILGLCFDSSATGAPHAHDPGLVALSFGVAAFAAYCSLDMAERLRVSGSSSRWFWTGMSGLTLGAGIWSMHFIAMTAFSTPFTQRFGPDLTLLSGLLAIGAVVAGLAVIGRKPSVGRFLAAGVIVGAGVVSMHYVGMAALQVPGRVVYRPDMFGLSVVIALTAATVALWLSCTVTGTWQKIAAALAMAIAICGMHYVAMAGTTLIISPLVSEHGPAVPRSVMASLVAVGVSGLILTGLVLAFLDRRMEAQAVREAESLRRLNVQLDCARQQAESAALAKGQFLATMSHEIRTPMNGVLGMLEAVLRSSLDADQRDQIVTARDSAASLLRILNDILDYSKLEAGQLAVEKLSFSVKEIVDEVVSVLAAQATEKSIELGTFISDDVPAWLMGDATRLRQVLLNLASNAMKFTLEGSVKIDVTYLGPVGQLRVDVSDTGVGLTDESCSRLFTRFTQADASTTRRFGGTGLGLAISRELVDLMGGDIGVSSRLGEGSRFWFVIPAEEGDEPDFSGTAAQGVIANVPAGLRILVAEDNLVNQKVLKALMAGQGHDLTMVENGAMAVEAVRNGEFDVVLMDISMPVMDGPAATRAIRLLDGAKAELPIIALTANAMAGDREVYLAAGMSDYVSKPINLEDLLVAIARQTGCPGSVPVRARGDTDESGAASEAAAASVAEDLDELLAGFA
ncbi:MAG: response regulator [Alphaproteobacteria bacterium]|nr:response regulator [Alphaproteobacteria bacterium]